MAVSCQHSAISRLLVRGTIVGIDIHQGVKGAAEKVVAEVDKQLKLEYWGKVDRIHVKSSISQ